MSSQVADSDIQLPNLNASVKAKNRSPLKNKLKNRRNLSIKQSWDKQNTAVKNLTTTNSNYNRMVKNGNGKDKQRVDQTFVINVTR